MKKLLFVPLMTLLSLTALAQSEPYAVLSDEGQTVTFYYDGNKVSRGGIDINNSKISYGSSSPYGTATTAVFDASFADYRPVSTAYWFEACSSLTTINGIENLNTSNVTDMNSMFLFCSGLTSLDVSGFDTSNVTDMSNMFGICSGLSILDVSGFDTSSVTDMYDIFYGCSGLTSLDVSGFDTSNVTSMTGMFWGCSGLTNLDVSGFDTSNVKYMAGMFSGCSGLTSLDVSSFDTSKVTNRDYMFYGCSGLTSLDLSSFDTSNVTSMNSMFYGCSGLASLDVSGFNTSNVTSMNDMFAGCSGLTSLDVSGFDTSNVTNMGSMFDGCSGLTSLDLSGFDTSKVTDMSYMFYGCSGLTSLDVSGFDTSNVTYMAGMFSGCSGLTSLDVSGFDTSKVTNMGGMFRDCSGLTSLDLSGFDTSNVTNMRGMFADCYGLTSLDLSGFDTSNVTSMGSMFNGCSGLTSLDVSSFNTSNVTDMDSMFHGCSGLKTIYVDEAKWSTANASYFGGGMFSGCTSLVGGNGTVYDENHTDVEYARIDKPGQPGYLTQKEPEMDPIDNADFGNDIDEDTDLDGTVVGDIYYNISPDDGSYDAEEGCIVVTTPTDDSVIDGQDIFGEDFQNGFTGIVFKVPAGRGTVKVEAQTTGTMVLKVKIGNSGPITMELEGKLKVSLPYNVTEDTYVYIYGGEKTTGAKGRRAAADGELKIYGIEVDKEATGISTVEPLTTDHYYTLDGRKLQGQPTEKGIYIVNGRAIVVK